MDITKAALEILNDEAVVDELLALDSAEEVQAKLKEKGLDLTKEDVEALSRKIAEITAAADSGELNDNELKNVAGGVNWKDKPDSPDKFDWDYFWQGFAYPLGRGNPRW